VAGSRPLSRLWWLALVPLVLGASRALIKYTWWAAMHSSLYGVPAEARRLREADANVDFNFRMLVGLALAATILVTLLMPQFHSLPSGVKGIARFVLAVVLVIALILLAAAGMSATGYFLQ
jgi:hypothetical protein